MGFPTINGSANSAEAANVESHVVSLPGSIQAGELLLVFFSIDGNTTVTFPAGWTKFFTQGTALATRLAVAWRKATGSEGASITCTSSSSEKSVHMSVRIGNAEDPTIQAPEASTGSNGNSVNPNSNNIAPTGGVQDYLVFSVEGNTNNILVTAYPADYSAQGTYSSGTGTGSCSIGIGYANMHASDINPGAFTIAGAEKWQAGTIAVHPVAVGWTGKVMGVTNPAKILGVNISNIGKVMGVI